MPKSGCGMTMPMFRHRRKITGTGSPGAQAQLISNLSQNQFHGLDRNIEPTANLARMHLGKARLNEVRSGFGSFREVQTANCLLLDGVGDYVNFDDHVTDLASYTKGSISGWFHLTSDNAAVNYLFTIARDTTAVNTYLAISAVMTGPINAIEVRLVQDGTTLWEWDQPTGTLTSYIDVWVNITVVHDGVSPKIYFDGADVTSSGTFNTEVDKTAWFKAILTDATDVSDNMSIGTLKLNSGATGFARASVSDWLITSDTLTEDEAIARGTWPDLYNDLDNLVFHWTMTDQNGLIVQNLESNSKHGVITVNSSLGTIRATDKTCPSADWPNVKGFTGARYFDGSSYISLGFAAGTPTNFEFTGWFRLKTAGSALLLDFRDSAGDGILLWANGNKLICGVNTTTTTAGANNAVVSGPWNKSRWRSFRATRSGGSLTLVVDEGLATEESDTQTSSASINTTTNGRIGSRSFTSPTAGWVGAFAKIRVDFDGVEKDTWLDTVEYTSTSATVIGETNANHGTPTGTQLVRIPVGTTADTDILGLTSQHTGRVPRSPIVNSPVVTFDGVGDYASVNFGARGTSYPQTLRGSFYADTVAAGVDCICTINDESASNLYWGIQRSGSSLQVIRRNTSEVATTTGPALSATTWYDYVLRLDSATAFTLWIRTHGGGVRKYTKTGLTSVALSTSIDAIALGVKTLTSPGSYWDGRIANHTCFDGTAMSDAQAESLLDDLEAVSGAVGLWRAIEGNSDVVHDETTNENHALITVNSSLATIWGQKGPTDLSIINDGCSIAHYYDGTNDYITGPSALPIPTSSFEVEMWVLHRASGSTDLILDGRDGNNDGFRIWFDSSNKFAASIDATTVASVNTYTDNKWHKIVVTWDGVDLQIDIDDGADTNSSATGAWTADQTSFRIGEVSFTTGFKYIGLLRGLKITNDGTVWANYRDGNKIDHSGNGRNGTTTGSLDRVTVPGTVAADAVTHQDKVIEGQTLTEDAGVTNSYWGNHLATELSDVTYTPGDDDEADVRFVRTQALGTPNTQPENDDRLIYFQPALSGPDKALAEGYTS